MSKEYRRTCTRCETTWFIPKALANEKAPGRLEMSRAKVKRAGSNLSLISFARGRRNAAVVALEERAARVAGNSRCPQCGSTAFRQEKA